MSMTPTPTQVPLSAWQRLRLFADCLPLIFFVVVTILYVTVLREWLGAPNPLLLLFMGLVILVVGYTAVQRFRDLLSGVALVQDDKLLRTRQVGRRGPGRSIYYGEFEGMGKLRVMPKVHYEGQANSRYRLTYSPVSKIVWLAESLP
jgi:hypothetical protein